MSIKSKCFIVLFIIFIGALILILPLSYNSQSVAPGYAWHIEGRVVDQSAKPLIDVRVLASGTERITGLNHVFGTKPKAFQLETKTDNEGKFYLSFQASFVRLLFSKVGYVDQTTNYIHYSSDRGDSTNQILKIYLQQLNSTRQP
jgi:hypothetical protein